MIAVVGTYQNGYIKLDKQVVSEENVRVIVTFPDDAVVSTEQSLSLSDFSFSRSQKALENYSGSFSDTLIEERRSES